MTKALLREKFQLTLPADVRAVLGAQPGDQIEFDIAEDGAVTLRATRVIAADQAWFWTPAWQAGERQADAEIARGEGEVFGADEEFLHFLRTKTHGGR